MTCELCGGWGWLRQDAQPGEPGFGQIVSCPCQREARLAARVARLQAQLGLGRALQTKTFATFQPRAGTRTALTKAQAFARSPDGWLVLVGRNGCGKTHLAAAIAHERVRQGHSALFAVVPDLLDHLRAAFAPSSEATYDRRFDQVRSTPLLVLDDLGAQQSTPWAWEKLYQLLNYRANDALPMVITTNLDVVALEERRLRSRLNDVDLVTKVLMTAGDYRQRRRSKKKA